jgi:hypothetical protein
MNEPAASQSPSAPRAGNPAPISLPAPERASLAWTWLPFLAAFALLVSFYGWTTVSNHLNWHFGAEQRDHYNLLVHGFLDGHLSLKADVPAAVLQSPNPYDPAQRPDGVALHDASLYQGKYYIYYGVVPAIVALLPFRLVAGFDLPVPVAVLGFAVAALAVGLSLIAVIRRRYFPRCGPGVAFWLALGFGFASCAPLLVRRSNIYEVPITSGSFFALTALACFYAAVHRSSRRVAWIAASSLAWGLAIGCRPTYFFAPLGLLFGYRLWLGREAAQPGRRGEAWRIALAAIGPIALIGAALAWYNYARFGRVTEFGVSYILSGVYESKIEHFRLRYVPWNAYAYWLAPGEWGRYFPFFHELPIAWAKPRQHYGMDFAFGLLANVPYLWLGALAWLRVKRSSVSAGPLRAVIAATTWAGFATAAFLMCFYAAMARYLGDFAPALAVLAAVGAMGIVERSGGCTGRWRGRVVRTVVVGYAIASVFIVGVVSLQIYSRLLTFNPNTYAALARAADAPVHAVERWFGRAPSGVPSPGTATDPVPRTSAPASPAVPAQRR